MRMRKKARRRNHQRCPGTGKVRYRDHREATEALNRIVGDEDHRRPSTPHRVYECPTCSGWHLTSSEPPRFPPAGR